MLFLSGIAKGDLETPVDLLKELSGNNFPIFIA